MSNLSVGGLAPEFDLHTDSGERLSLRSLRGKTVILYFYPKDDTPGCTTEACGFRDLFPRFSAGDAVILGVSPDSVASHVKFKQKFAIPFPLLADEDHAVAERYGVWVEKMTYGRKRMGIERTTFVIGPDGMVKRVFAKVKADGHAEEVASALADLGL